MNGEGTKSKRGFLRTIYRSVLDSVEEFTMSFSDFVLVNSKFTKEIVHSSFPKFRSAKRPVSVLYPCINLDKFVPPARSGANVDTLNLGPIVSLNRFERKKNIGLFLDAVAKLRNKLSPGMTEHLKVIVAGGYDNQNLENKEYLHELKMLAKVLRIDSIVTFSPSISDETRATLLQTAICVCYTPHREHFGIVPIEAMYAGSPVIAVNSGGPKETIIDNETGRLVSANADAFADAIYSLMIDPERAKKMGFNGHKRVKDCFGIDNFRSEWNSVVDDALKESLQNFNAKQKRAQLLMLILNLIIVTSSISMYNKTI